MSDPRRHAWLQAHARRPPFNPKSKASDFQNETGVVTVYLRHGTFEAITYAPRTMDAPVSVGIYKGDGHQVTFEAQQPISTR